MYCHSVCTSAVDCVALLVMEDMEDEGSRESSEDAGTEDTGETDYIQGVGDETYDNENVRDDKDTAEAKDMTDVHNVDDVKYNDKDDDSSNVDTRFKSLLGKAAVQLAKSIKLRKFEEKFSKSLLIRSAAQESMGKISIINTNIFVLLIKFIYN